MKYISVEEGTAFIAVTINAPLNEAGKKLEWYKAGRSSNEEPKCLQGPSEWAVAEVRQGHYRSVYLIRPAASDGPISFWGSIKKTLKANMTECLNAAARHIETNSELLEELEALSVQYSMETL
jgi:hypothetical protein